LLKTLPVALTKGLRIFHKIWELSQNSKRQKGDVKQLRCCFESYGRPGPPGFVHPCFRLHNKLWWIL